jgi:hypothetical protein
MVCKRLESKLRFGPSQYFVGEKYYRKCEVFKHHDRLFCQFVLWYDFAKDPVNSAIKSYGLYLRSPMFVMELSFFH